jgi:hypothetical protein
LSCQCAARKNAVRSTKRKERNDVRSVLRKIKSRQLKKMADILFCSQPSPKILNFTRDYPLEGFTVEGAFGSSDLTAEVHFA